MRAMLAIAKKEFRDFARERVYLIAFFVQLFLVVGVIFVATLYSSLSSPDAMSQYIPRQEVRVGVYGAEMQLPGITVVPVENENVVLQELNLVAAVIFPEGFSERLERGEGVRVRLLLDNTNVLSGYANARVVEALDSMEERARLELAKEREIGREELLEPVELKVSSIGGGSAHPPDFIQLMYGILMPFILLLPTFIASNMTTDLIVGEKEKRTYELLISAPVPSGQIVVGKALPVIAVALVEAFLWIRVLELRGLPINNKLLLLAYLLLLDVLFLGFGIAISAVSESVRDANSIVTLLLLGASFLFFAPVAVESAFQELSPAKVIAHLASSHGAGTTALPFVALAVTGALAIFMGGRLLERREIFK